MSWIESHAALARHPKTRALMRNLDINKRDAIGLLHMLWWWALDFAPEGSLGAYTAQDVADAVEWEGDAETLLRELVATHWLDATEDGLIVHDWEDYAGRLVDRRRHNAERKREARARVTDDVSTGRPVPATTVAPLSPALPDLTGPDLTGPDQPESVACTRTADAVDETFKSGLEDAFWEDFGSREAVRDSIAKALSHKSRSNYADQRAFLRSWLREDAARALSRRPGVARNGHSPPPSDAAAREEMARKFAHLGATP